MSAFKKTFLTGLTGYSGLKYQNSSCKSSSKSFTFTLRSRGASAYAARDFNLPAIASSGEAGGLSVHQN